jgi:hypothetical protein
LMVRKMDGVPGPIPPNIIIIRRNSFTLVGKGGDWDGQGPDLPQDAQNGPQWFLFPEKWQR